MKLQLIRNATMKIEYENITFLTDPMLSDPGEIESFAGIAPNPTVSLPMAVDMLLADVDMVLASHLHQDHFDLAAMDIIPKQLPIYSQPENEDKLREAGFERVHPIRKAVSVGNVTITRIGGRHGTGKWAQELGPVSGFVLSSAGEPTVYWAGDTIWCNAVQNAIRDHYPDIIIVHACGAVLQESSPIVMNAEHVVKVCRERPDAVVVAVHMEALDHATVTREQLRQYANQQGISSQRLKIPDDGQWLKLPSPNDCA